jgi:hypothetical protein
MRILLSISILLFCFVAVGCRGPVAEVKAFLDEKDDVLLQMGKKIEADPTEDGIAAARKVFEARKDDLKAKRAALEEKHLERYGDLTTMLLDSGAHDLEMLNVISSKLPTFDLRQKFGALEKDFKEAVGD